MKIFRNKLLAAAIALLLTLTITGALVALPITAAHDPPLSIPAWCYAGVSPRTVGVNQQALIVFWCNWVPPTAAEDSRYGDRWVFNVDVTAPDGTTETLGPFDSDPVGGSYTTYTPTQIGTYAIVVQMPAYTITGLPSASGVPINDPSLNDVYGPATSEPVYLTVQEDPVTGWYENPAPTSYWTRPINSANRDWSSIAGNWLGGDAQSIAPGCSAYVTSMFTPNEVYGHGIATESAHILWTMPYYAGGIMDQWFGDTGYATSHYQGINLGNPIIIQGKLILDWRNTAHSTSGWLVIDLYTGELLSFENSTKPAFGQIYNYESPNQHGGFPYLWRTSGVTLPENNTSELGKQTWEMLDGYTLQSVAKVANVSAGGTGVYGIDGSILRYSLNTIDGVQYLQVWNSSAIPSMLGGSTGTNYWQWRPMGGAFGGDAKPLGYYVHDGNQGWSLNVTITPAMKGSLLTVRQDDFVIGGTAGKNNGTYIEEGNLWCLSLKPGEEGTLLWNKTFTPPQSVPDLAAGSGLTSYGVGLGEVDPEDGVFLFEERMTLQRWGYSLDTMQLLWGPTQPEEAFNFYGLSETIYEGKLLSYGYGGQLRAYDLTTGDILWTYNATTVGDESPYAGNYPIGIACIADGKIYTVSSEHSPTQPLWRGPNLRCVDAETGEEVWSILFWGGRMSPTEPNVYIADGIVVGLNYYDMSIYAFGKGPSATTVTASPKVSTFGNNVLVEGAVTDQSPAGRRNTNGILDFTLKDTPAISDESMAAWMEYMFMQQPMPANAMGVEVKLETLDPNGNFYEIGTTTSDASGYYSYAFTPEVPGTYTIIATFEGSNSYYSSFAETAINVQEAPKASPTAISPIPTAPSQTPSPSPTLPVQTSSSSPSTAVVPPTSALPTTTYLAIAAAAVVIVVAALALVLRRRNK
ncbi:MAG: PQQ-binding-like beta-propeller repeat protein [Candidatus Bathyarchaeia archaeon]|jgi:hypothetical protein